LLLERYMRRFLLDRANAPKRVAEDQLR